MDFVSFLESTSRRKMTLQSPLEIRHPVSDSNSLHVPYNIHNPHADLNLQAILNTEAKDNVKTHYKNIRCIVGFVDQLHELNNSTCRKHNDLIKRREGHLASGVEYTLVEEEEED